MPHKQTRYGTIKISPCLWGIDFWETGDFIELRTQNTSTKSEIGILLKRQNIYLTYCKQTTCFLFNQIEHWIYARLLIGSILYAKWTKFVYTVLVSVQTFSYVKIAEIDQLYHKHLLYTAFFEWRNVHIRFNLTYICIFYFLWFHVSYECKISNWSRYDIFMI